MKRFKPLYSKISSSFWRFGLTIGLVTSLSITIFVTSWEWVENPGGIFRGSGGTSWWFVYETAISWFVPTFAGVAIVAGCGHLLRTWIRR